MPASNQDTQIRTVYIFMSYGYLNDKRSERAEGVREKSSTLIAGERVE